MAARSTEIASGVVDLNQRTYRSIAGLLPEETARQLRQRYYSGAFPEAAFAVNSGDSVFNKALGLDSLTDDERAAVLATRDNLRRSLDAVRSEPSDERAVDDTDQHHARQHDAERLQRDRPALPCVARACQAGNHGERHAVAGGKGGRQSGDHGKDEAEAGGWRAS
jgi:hypothetical protein